jgi:hypothetical protein
MSVPDDPPPPKPDDDQNAPASEAGRMLPACARWLALRHVGLCIYHLTKDDLA